MTMTQMLIAGLTTTGLISRASGGNMQTRTVTGTPGRIAINNGAGSGSDHRSVELLFKQQYHLNRLYRNP